ncbi:hypothetical protein K504DRAFT_164848 [Pleomassaria siparia CBS 279.74]|uniref:Uncharacterized protein n=1 Tax=Pleomassaria siparia CBS 279.74 TaxID=1314801 RepID=A0A6G1JTK0_9PLEO|nr:hypothetical protein K504DRAFT_164848 [Pleomassaria siparia CBS 279.74]
MSTPSSDGGPSVSSEPSVISSHTLNSRYSGTRPDNGQGSSPHRTMVTRQSGAADNMATESRSRNSGQFLAVEPIHEQEFGNRWHRKKRSGGFLLDSTFPSGPRARQPRGHTPPEDVKGKRGSYHEHSNDISEQGRIRGGNGMILHSPLSREVMVADQGTPDRKSRIDSANNRIDHNDELRVPKTRQSEYGVAPGANSNGNRDEAQPAPRAAIDPNQIVHMALNLSESRRRNLSAGQLVAPQASGSRRVTSTGIQQDGSFRNYGTGSSLRQYLNEQRRNSRNISPTGSRGSPSTLRQISASMPRSASMSLQPQQYAISDATIARRDKARAYIELRVEYLRLLQFLPPLRPDSSAPGNFTMTANNVPGSPHAQLTRVSSNISSKHELGRPYNPLQYIRNRRNRARERRSLDHIPEEFLDVEQVREWVDRAEQESRRPDYRQQDRVALPKYHDDHQGEERPSKPSRPRMGWIFTPEELLADAHWVEQNDNKSLIEDRHGRHIFPSKEPQKQDLLLPRASREYPENRPGSWVEGVPRLSAEIPLGEESEPISERGRKRRILPAFRAESPKHKKHGWRGPRPQSGNFSDGSDSNSDSQKNRSRKSRRMADINNTGPLELKMREMMAKEAREAEAYTPDTPNKWGKPDLFDGQPLRTSMNVASAANGSIEKREQQAFASSPKNRPSNLRLSLDVPPSEPRSSFDDLDTTAPNTPLRQKHFPYSGASSSPPPSREGSVTRKSKKSRLGVFRSDESSKGPKHEQKDESDTAGVYKKRGSQHASDEVVDNGSIGTAIMAAPSAVKSLLAHRKDESVGSLHGHDGWHRINSKDFKESKEPSSAVTRFFKGVKSEGSKVGEYIFRRDRPPEDSDSETGSSHHSPDESETDEGSSKPERKHRSNVVQSTTTTTANNNPLKKNGRYHLDLPSFRSTNATDEDGAYATDPQLVDPITRQSRERANNRPTRFDQLAPPRMDLGSISSTSPTIAPRHPSLSTHRDRINKVLARPGGVDQGGLPVTSLTNAKFSETASRHTGTSRPRLESRHWSITDENGGILRRKSPVHMTTPAEIARIRALFLCSGIKAREIARRAQTNREPPSFLARAAKTTNTQLIPVQRKEEHVLAARILVRNIESSTSALHASAEQFRESTIKDLTCMISDLKFRVETDLFPRVRSSGDEAVRITSEISGAAPLTVKQISDEIDKMIRMRRRRMKWVRRVGWMLVEWMLLGIMWWVWFIVVVLGFVKRVVGWNLQFVRWLLWI